MQVLEEFEFVYPNAIEFSEAYNGLREKILIFAQNMFGTAIFDRLTSLESGKRKIQQYTFLMHIRDDC